MNKFFLLTASLCLILGVSFAFAATPQDSDKQKTQESETPKSESAEAKSDTDAAAEDAFEPIDNMHHFMEYISLPSYRALKKSFAGEAPENRKGWKPIKSHALILAETSALVAARPPKGATEEQATQWRQISREVYQSGKELYKSAGDFEAAKKHYGVMIESCNKCHTVFDNGKHQLKK